jgi:folate-binding protein YgfZ
VTGTPDYQALTQSAAFVDFSNRGRLCLIGADRQRFLNGQVTNNIKDLKPGQGCYAALANAKGKMTSDLFIYILLDEILLDFEPGLTQKVTERLEKFIIADDVQIVDASSSYGLISVSGPKANPDPNSKLFEIKEVNGTYLANTPRLGMPGRDYFFPVGQAPKIDLPEASLEAFDTVRIEQGIPKFGVDMDENTLVPEAIEHAISYNKGCYIGQEVIARIRTYGQVAKALRGLRFESGAAIPGRGDKIFRDGKEVGFVTSAVFSPKLNCPIALGYVRKECNVLGTNLEINGARVEIVALPFQP